MKLVAATVIALFLVFAGVYAQEAVTLTTPVVKTDTTYNVKYIGLDYSASSIVIQLQSNTGFVVVKTYDSTTTPTGATLLHNLNTANFSVNSLMKAVYNRLLTDGVIPAGSITGSAQ